MLYQDGISSHRANAELARILGGMKHGASEERLQIRASGYWGGACTFTLYPSVAGQPQWGFSRSGNNSLFLFSGVPSLGIASEFVNGYGTSDYQQSAYGLHPQVEATYGAMQANLIGGIPVGENTYCTVAGHSYGGAFAQSFAYLCAVRNPSCRVKAITFGSPRAFSSRATVNIMERYRTARYFNSRDPISLLPPHYSESLVGFTAMSAATVANVNQWQHLDVGYQINPDHTITEREAPDPNCVPPAASLAGWASGLLADPVLEHSIASYAARMEDYLVADPFANLAIEPPQPEQIPPGWALHSLPSQVNARRDPVPNPRVELAGLAGAVPREDKPFYAAKTNGRYYCFYREAPIVSCKGRREAAKIARDYNQIVTQWQNAEIGAVETILAALEYEMPPEF